MSFLCFTANATAACIDELLTSGEVTVTRTEPSPVDPFFREIRTSARLRIASQNLPDGSPLYFEIVDLDPRACIDAGYFKIEAKVIGGVLSFHVRTRAADGSRSKILRGRDVFDRMMAHFDQLVREIYVQWDYGDNLRAFNQAVGEGVDVTNAAARTWTARQAARYGFTRIQIVEAISRPVLLVIAELTRP